MVLRHLQTGLLGAASNLRGRSSSDARRTGYARSCADDALQWRVVILVPALLLIMVAVAAEAPASEPQLAHGEAVRLGSMAPRGTRRVIYNSDPSNTTVQLSEPVAKPEELRQVIRTYAREGNIDTLVQEIWHQCWTEWWRTDKCPYDTRPQHQRLVSMMDDGVMPIEIYIDECHRQKMEFIAGFRMNDRHGNNVEFFQQLDTEHPEWILKEYKPTGGGKNDPRNRGLGCSLDYSQDGVRDFLFSIMQEAASRFDVDGIEFNWLRMPECFPRDKAEQSYPIMSGFVRRIRAMLDEVGEQKGRKLILGVRVLQDLEQCKRWGLDVPTWIKEGFIDYVAPGDHGFTDFNAPYEEFVRLGRAYGCYVYPQAECRLGYTRWKESNRTEYKSPEQYRAAVQNFYGAGADGFSTSNYFLLWHRKSGLDLSGPGAAYPSALNTLIILRDPKQVVAGDCHYLFVPIWGPGVRYLGGAYPERIVLSRRKTGQRSEFRFRMCENLPAKSVIAGEDLVSGAVLLFSPSIVPGDEIELDINGETIPTENIKTNWPNEQDKLPLCRFALSSPPAVYGDNYLGLRLVKSATDTDDDIIVDEVEVMVKTGN